MRRRRTLETRLPLLLEREDSEMPEPDTDVIADDRLRLIFTCCHPALAPEAQIALTLRLVCGVATADIARALLVADATMAARLTRAKKKIAVAALRAGPPGRFTLQAAIAALHVQAPSYAQTDWPQILTLYDELLRIWPTPVVALNRAVAVAMVDGPQAALAEVEALERDGRLAGYRYLPATKADLLHRLGRDAEAASAYQAALALSDNVAEQEFLAARVRSTQPPP